MEEGREPRTIITIKYANQNSRAIQNRILPVNTGVIFPLIFFLSCFLKKVTCFSLYLDINLLMCHGAENNITWLLGFIMISKCFVNHTEVCSDSKCIPPVSLFIFQKSWPDNSVWNFIVLGRSFLFSLNISVDWQSWRRREKRLRDPH